MIFHQRHRWFIVLIILLVNGFDLLAERVASIKIEGNQLTKDRVFYKNLRTRVGEDYRPVIFNEDIKRLYELGLFNRIDMSEGFQMDGIHLTLSVVEKPILSEIVYEGQKKIKRSRFEDDLRSLVGARYDESLAKADVLSIEMSYRDAGHLFVEVSSRTEKVDDTKVRLVFMVSENFNVRVGGIEFLGNESLPKGRLKKVMETKIDRLFSKGVFDEGVFDLDLKKLASYYRSLGFLDAKVKPGKSYFSEDRSWLYLQVLIEEGPLYVIDDIIFRGNSILISKELKNKIPVKPGQPYTDLARLKLLTHIEKKYGEIGRVYSTARVRANHDSEFPHVSIDVEIRESEEVYVESVEVEGNYKTRDVVIRREMEFYPGEMINSGLLDRSRRNLTNLGFFSRNDIDIEPGSEPHLARMVIRVEEKETGSINFGLGFSNVESITAQVKYTQRNFDWRDRKEGVGGFFSGRGYIGDAQTLSVSINTGTQSRRFNIDFNEPWVFNRKIRFGFGLYHTESSIADDYDEKQEGFYLRVGKEFIRDLEGFLTYSFREHVISDVDPSVSFLIRSEEGSRLVSSLNNNWVYEGRDNRFFPTEGWYLNPSLTLAGSILGGDQDFYKLEFEAKTHWLVLDFDDQNQHTLNFRTKWGFVNPYGDSSKVAIFEKFFAGGLGSVRGFPNRSLSPKVNGDEVGGQFISIANLEYSVPINEQAIRGILFYDIGNAFDDLDDYAFSDLRMSVGVGLRLKIPALGEMPLSLDFAKPIRRQDTDETETFSFNFGNFF